MAGKVSPRSFRKDLMECRAVYRFPAQKHVFCSSGSGEGLSGGRQRRSLPMGVFSRRFCLFLPARPGPGKKSPGRVPWTASSGNRGHGKSGDSGIGISSAGYME